MSSLLETQSLYLRHVIASTTFVFKTMFSWEIEAQTSSNRHPGR